MALYMFINDSPGVILPMLITWLWGKRGLVPERNPLNTNTVLLRELETPHLAPLVPQQVLEPFRKSCIKGLNPVFVLE